MFPEGSGAVNCRCVRPPGACSVTAGDQVGPRNLHSIVACASTRSKLGQDVPRRRWFVRYDGPDDERYDENESELDERFFFPRSSDGRHCLPHAYWMSKCTDSQTEHRHFSRLSSNIRCLIPTPRLKRYRLMPRITRRQHGKAVVQ